jgi:L-alanine-DL-glutamate epimerase-like enolase superfamily enzyme
MNLVLFLIQYSAPFEALVRTLPNQLDIRVDCHEQVSINEAGQCTVTITQEP